MSVGNNDVARSALGFLCRHRSVLCELERVLYVAFEIIKRKVIVIKLNIRLNILRSLALCDDFTRNKSFHISHVCPRRPFHMNPKLFGKYFQRVDERIGIIIRFVSRIGKLIGHFR